MGKLRKRAVGVLVSFIAVGLTIVATIVAVFAVQARVRLPDLDAWHRLVLRDDAALAADASFAAYRAAEDRLLAEVRARVLDDPGAADTLELGRYNPHSTVARLALDTPYNRSYELMPAGEARGGAVLVHGLTDSPYAMRSLAETLQAQGFRVLALRLPGHGTLPSGLVGVTWENWLAAVSLAARHVAAAVGADKPLILGGYSTGAALVTLYAVRSLGDPALPRPQGLYLVSPAIGISPFAVLTNVVSALSFVPAFEKSRWIDVVPEYDPYKYNSFPVNAANQIYTLTRVLQRALDAAERRGELAEMPRVVAFQSIIDATITANEVIRGLLGRLPPGGHELVVFDVNRSERTEGFLAPAIREDLERLRNATGLPFRTTLIGNRGPDTRRVAAYTREAGQAAVAEQALPLEWPAGVFSVGHGSLPFPPDDPIYGIAPPTAIPLGFSFGSIAVRGENGALVVPLGAFARLRSNPFFDVIRDRIVETLPDAAAGTR